MNYVFIFCKKEKEVFAKLDKYLKNKTNKTNEQWKSHRLNVSYRLKCYLSCFSHFWLATVQDVLHALWHEAWHLPQPPDAAVFLRLAALMVLTCFILIHLLYKWVMRLHMCRFTHIVAGVLWFEHRNVGVRVRCLTAWRYPNIVIIFNYTRKKYFFQYFFYIYINL